jgi:hypothetical protein
MTTWLNVSAAEGSSSSITRKGCYTFHDVDSTWNEAKKACRDVGGHLVTMETTDEWNKVKGFIAEKVKNSGSYTHWYIGLRKESGTWKWTEAGSPGVAVASDDSRWQSGQPSSTASEVCAEINSFYRKQYGHFNNVMCDRKDAGRGIYAKRGYICEDL